MIHIETFSYLHGGYVFQNEKWYKVDKATNELSITKYPPQEGTCKVSYNNIVVYCGDVSALKSVELYKKYFVEKYEGFIE